MHTHTRLAWLRLNVDGVLIAVFGLIMASDVLSPHVQELVIANGSVVPATFWLWSALYVAAAVLMMVGFITHKIGPELAGRLVLCLGLALETARSLSILGVNDDTVTLAVITVAVSVLAAVRASVLLARDGLAVVIPGKDGTP